MNKDLNEDDLAVWRFGSIHVSSGRQIGRNELGMSWDQKRRPV